ncbi:hypothetical protein [Mumia zhuanghuii]|uniref:Nuclear transport factor 2 family protein n=1 Tax=Mumia zhuanghuii TaxID=2585211 RepID=A0A5C4MTJ2_9ACTN|nr:hypothetical protein [Mumia zhuanghuii]TNC47372.1 hypothetical protein FHE65_10185 [Mumia zhuanghuii]TNC47649.1 hypothetical protein FHE65_09180 [Mumia zhuanghuii]
MTSQRPRWVAAAALAGLLVLSACGSDGDSGSLADATPSATASASKDADGFTAEEREVIDAVEAYATAIFARGTTPVAEALQGKVTDELYSVIVPDERKITEDAGKQRIGEARVEARSVAIKGDEAVASVCLDATKAFVVDKGETEVGPGARIGIRRPMKVELERADGSWLVDAPRAEEGTC